MGKPVRVFWYCEKWQAGGIQKIQVNLLSHIDSQRVRFDIAVSEDDTDIFDQVIAKAGARKIVTLKRCYSSPGKRSAANFFAVRRILRDGAYDVVHFNACHGVELIYVFWAWFYRVPVRIVHCRNNDIGAGGRSRIVKLLCHRICKQLFHFCPNVRLANSDLAARWLFTKSDLKHDRVTILKNGIDLAAFAPNAQGRRQTRRKLGIDDHFVVGHIGHFSYQKNHEFLISIFAAITRRRPDAVLLLIGEGDGKEEARRKAEQLGLSEKVLYCGVTDQVPPLMWAMDAFVLPSRFEGFGNVLVEAQAAGLPCFASQGMIPKAAAVTPLLHWISLKESAETWADRILAETVQAPRNDYSGLIQQAGYDIADMADFLEKLYVGEDE